MELTHVVAALRAQVEAHEFIDVTKGAEIPLGISRAKFIAALAMLQDDEYAVTSLALRQKDAPKVTTVIRVLHKKGVTYSTLVQNQYNITLPMKVDSE